MYKKDMENPSQSQDSLMCSATCVRRREEFSERESRPKLEAVGSGLASVYFLAVALGVSTTLSLSFCFGKKVLV